ncbi:1-aminocyclopropane-1-carboxylate synthase-like protein 1 [Penaeus japonicus]|uniref:1-aminocyclopropane-1-carboxylate synthase-like protein 1 n=1 Tax=Penaeus japonicus TaxID=27405 RepID=UPI001C70F494|nr:1-aminocyclopropane-1-carboxylate synthase-like protein 1 [Penaeus japonicus]XP_042856909.1 1-aminocyclopropane-1-carboxylate synthase-like protein 1 [Penaeus japonicus]
MSASPGECHEEAGILSRRGAVTAEYEDFLTQYLTLASANPYHPVTNKEGIINLGTAVNRLMEDELSARLLRGDALSYSPSYQHYYDFDGTQELKGALVDFLGRHFNPAKDISQNELVVLNGVTSCLDALSHALCDPGDVIITPTPAYGRMFTDVQDRAGALVLPLELRQEADSSGESFLPRAEDLEAQIESLRQEGRRVRAFMLVHPNNPLGDVYSPQLLASLMHVCARHEVHFISDEIYALSIFPNEAEPRPPFHSVLSLPHPDPERTHVLWGLSKDFGLAGFRLGVIISRCEKLMTCLRAISIYKCTPHLMHHASATLLSDTAWCDDVYIRLNSERLGRTYRRARERLEAMGARVREARAGLFVWFSIHDFMETHNEEEEMDIHAQMMQAGVYVVPGSKLYCVNPGWIRLIFSVTEDELDEGLRRIESVLKNRRKKNTHLGDKP